METLDKIDHFGTWFDAFLKHGSLVSLLLAIIGGWFVAIGLKFPIHEFAKDDRWATWLTRTLCVVAAAALTFWTWPQNDPGAWAIVAGFGSPIFQFVLIMLVKLWKPSWYETLLLKRVTFSNPDDEVESDARPAEPRSDTH